MARTKLTIATVMSPGRSKFRIENGSTAPTNGSVLMTLTLDDCDECICGEYCARQRMIRTFTVMGVSALPMRRFTKTFAGKGDNTEKQE
jgi:hypothetical protein